MDTFRGLDDETATLVDSFLYESPTVRTDAAVLNRCGPIAFALAVYLRANSAPAGLIHVTGQPPGFPPGTGHYMTTSGRWVIDCAYRQFKPTAPLPVIYDRADLDPAPATGEPGRPWHPWTHISGELEHDDPLYPDFVEYDANTDPLAYLAPGTDDPEWTTPIDER